MLFQRRMWQNYILSILDCFKSPPPFEQTIINSIKKCLTPILLEISSVILENKCITIYLHSATSTLRKKHSLTFEKKIQCYLFKNACMFGKVWLKMTQWFLRICSKWGKFAIRQTIQQLISKVFILGELKMGGQCNYVHSLSNKLTSCSDWMKAINNMINFKFGINLNRQYWVE